MPATFSPDCMAVCIPADQNESFVEDNLNVDVDDDGTEIICDKDSLLPSALKNGHAAMLTTIPEVEYEEFREPAEISSVLSGRSGGLPPIPESEDWEYFEEHEPGLYPEEPHMHHAKPQSLRYHDGREEFVAPSYARTVLPDVSDYDVDDTAQLFHQLLHLRASSHDDTAFSGADSHQYLFQHFDADTLEFEEAAAVRPKFIGHYLLGDCLGEGSYAKVKEALNTDTLERAAVKIFSPVKLKRIPNGMQNVLKEVNILRKLNHPNVCRMKELLKKELKKKLYLIMDYAVCAISDLTKTLPHERLPAWKAHYYFLQLMDGLQYCHSRGVVHKDLKPSNLVITTKDTLKIIDFGVAEQLSPYAATDLISSSQGCPAVQPPEVADGVELFSGFKLDVWSCGVTFFSLCAGNSKFPFVGDTVYELFANISERLHEMPDEVRLAEPEFCLLIDALLQKKESDRPSLDELRHHVWIRRHWPMPPAGIPIQDTIEKAETRSVESFLPYIQAYFHLNNSTRTSRAGSICCATGGRVPHHHHHYPRCHSHHLTPHNSTRRSCRQSQDRRRTSVESRITLTHHTSVRNVAKEVENHDNHAHEPAQDRSPTRVNAEQGCFSFKKWKICRVT